MRLATERQRRATHRQRLINERRQIEAAPATEERLTEQESISDIPQNDPSFVRLNQILRNRRATRNAQINETNEQRSNEAVPDPNLTQQESISDLPQNDTLFDRVNEILQSSRSTHNSRIIETDEQRDSRLLARRTQYHENQRVNQRQNPRHRLAFNYDPSASYTILGDVGKCDVICKHCNASLFKNEPKGLCCANGKVKLPPTPPPPPEIQAYLDDMSQPEAKHFFANIRKYNTCFQMTSFRTKKSTGQTNTHQHAGNFGFTTTFTIQGQIYHSIKSLQPESNDRPAFLQIYFSGEDELDQRQVF